jgi:hypothetical protein
MVTKILKIAIPVFYEIAILLSLYDFSLHSDYVPWGDSKRDGLDMLSFFFWFLPAMIFFAFIKMFFWKKNNFIRFSYFVYAAIFFLAVLIYAMNSAAITLLMVLIIASFLAIGVIAEHWMNYGKPNE